MKKKALSSIVIVELILSIVVGTLSIDVAKAHPENAPAIKILQPNMGETYNSSNIRLEVEIQLFGWTYVDVELISWASYSLDDNPPVLLTIILPSPLPPLYKVNPIADLTDLSDGKHSISIQIETTYNHSATANTSFTIDTTHLPPLPTSSPTPTLSSSTLPSFPPPVQKHFEVRNTMYQFPSSILLCSFNATAGSWVEQNITVTGSKPFETTFEVASSNHGVIFSSTVYGNTSTIYAQTVFLNYDDEYNITVAKQPFYSVVGIKGTINLCRNTTNPSVSPSTPTPSLSPSLSSSTTQQPTLTPTSTIVLHHSGSQYDYSPLLWITAIIAIIIGVAVYAKYRKKS